MLIYTLASPTILNNDSSITMKKRGALYTKRDSKFEIVFLEQYPTLSDARKREIQIKKWRREKKDLLIKKYSKGLETKM